MENTQVTKKRQPILTSILSFFVGLTVLALLILLVWYAARFLLYLFRIFPTLDPEIAAAIIAGSVTIFSSVAVFILSKYFEAKAQRKAAHRDKKVELYSSFVEKLLGLFSGSAAGDVNAAGITGPFLLEMHRKLILWSGPEVIKAYAEWNKELTTQRNGPRAKSMIRMIDFFLALREDLGHSNRGIKHEYLVRFMLRESALFMQMFKVNPDVTLNEIAAMEDSLKAAKK